MGRKTRADLFMNAVAGRLNDKVLSECISESGLAEIEYATLKERKKAAMTAVFCDICKGSLSMDADGEIAVCDSCGMKHTKERIKTMAQEIISKVASNNVEKIRNSMALGLLSLWNFNWVEAKSDFNQVLVIDSECAPAYIGKLCAELHKKCKEDLINHYEPLDKIPNYQKAIQFADVDYREKLISLNQLIIQNQEQHQSSMQELKKSRELISKYSNCISCGDYFTACLTPNGEVFTDGMYPFNISSSSWHDITAVSSGSKHVVGLKSDGTVVASGNNQNDQCNTNNWRNIVAIATGSAHTVGLTADGTVIAVGANNSGQCDVSSWESIKAIFASADFTIGIKSNNALITTRKISDETEQALCDISVRNEIVSIKVVGGWYHLVVLKSDGTVVLLGCASEVYNTYDWRNVVAIATGMQHIVGLKIDGTVIATGQNNRHGQNSGPCDTDYWRDIVAISAAVCHTIGLKVDGRAVTTGSHIFGMCNVSAWREIGPINNGSRGEVQKRQYEQWNYEKQRQEEEQRLKQQHNIEQSNRWVQLGLCRHCGGDISGLFKKKCNICGRPK